MRPAYIRTIGGKIIYVWRLDNMNIMDLISKFTSVYTEVKLLMSFGCILPPISAISTDGSYFEFSINSDDGKTRVYAIKKYTGKVLTIDGCKHLGYMMDDSVKLVFACVDETIAGRKLPKLGVEVNEGDNTSNYVFCEPDVDIEKIDTGILRFMENY